MTLFIDADACPVVDRAMEAAARHGIGVTLVCDDAHEMRRDKAETIVVSRGADSADFALVNRVRPGDVVVTQDYGLAAMCLAKNARILHQDGKEYTDQNIDGLLAIRHEAKKFRRAGGHTRGPAKRTHQQDEDFSAALERLLQELTQGNLA